MFFDELFDLILVKIPRGYINNEAQFFFAASIS